MTWQLSHRADLKSRRLADRHYNRQKAGSPQFMPPGRCLVFWQEGAVWGSSWPFAEFVKHAWAGAWICSLFRNESESLSSTLITEAVAATRYLWGEPPALGFVTFVDPDKTRRKRDPGRCYRRAGWHVCGETKGGLIALALAPGDMPAASAPLLSQPSLPLGPGEAECD